MEEERFLHEIVDKILTYSGLEVNKEYFYERFLILCKRKADREYEDGKIYSEVLVKSIKIMLHHLLSTSINLSPKKYKKILTKIEI